MMPKGRVEDKDKDHDNIILGEMGFRDLNGGQEASVVVKRAEKSKVGARRGAGGSSSQEGGVDAQKGEA